MLGKDDECRPFGSGAWILIHDEPPGKPPPGFHLSWNMFFTWDQKHLHFIEMFYRLTHKHIPYCFISEDAVSKTRTSCFITGFDHLGGLLLSSVTVFVTRDEALPIVFGITSNVITTNLPLYSVYDWLQWDCLSAGYLCFAMLHLCCLFRFSKLHNFHKP